MNDSIVVLSNCGSRDEAFRVARALVESRLAACVNVIPGVHSIYRWQGQVEEAEEWTLLIKTRRHLFEELSRELRRVHSYEVPEILALPVAAGTEDYLAWIATETAPDRP